MKHRSWIELHSLSGVLFWPGCMVELVAVLDLFDARCWGGVSGSFGKQERWTVERHV